MSATMIAANKAGIKVFVTGGIGGVHREAQTSNIALLLHQLLIYTEMLILLLL